jgi:dUTP pyrophosphatase
MDVKAFINSGEPIPIMPGKTEVIHTGLYVELPQGWEIQVRSRSGLAAKNKVCVLNSPGTIDSDYRGEIMVILTNLGSENFFVYSGDRIAQLVLSKVTRIHFDTVDNLSDTARGNGGFGSTGK